MEPEISRTGLTVLSDPESAVIDIVFVHGLQGDPRNTWTWEPPRAQTPTFSKLWSPRKRVEGASADIAGGDQGGGGSAVFWPKDLLAADFPTARVMTFGYDSIITRGYKAANQGNLFSHSGNLLYELVQKRIRAPKRGLLFIAHSLGGIIVKDALRHSETHSDIEVVDIFESTTGILFFGTPHRGSEGWASLGDGIAKVAGGLLGFDVNSKSFVFWYQPPLNLSSAETHLLLIVVPYPSNPGFIGRSATLDKLKERFGPAFAQNGITYQVRAALFGLGGIGKTQIALAFAYWAQKEYPSLSIFWIHASTPERFRQGAAQIAQECKIPGHDDPKADVAQVLKVWLEEKSQEPWLMVLDNADDVQMFFGPDSTLPSTHAEPSESSASARLRRYIPNSSHGAILVTSRNKSAAVKFTKSTGTGIISVDGMDGKECSDLIRTKLGDDHLDPVHITQLMDRLEHVPLAIIQAVSFIQETDLSISRYLKLLDEGDNVLVDALSQSFEAEGRDESIQNAVTATWIISFDQIRKQYPAASDIFARMCFFDRQTIPEAFLSHRIESVEGYIQSPMGQLELEKCLGVLKAFSFISEGNDRTITMHRLVHLVMRRWLNARGESERWAREALRTVSDLFPSGSEFENWKTCELYLPHVNAVLSLEGPLEDHAKVYLVRKTAVFLNRRARDNHAHELLLEAVPLAKKVLGEEHPDTLFIVDCLVEVYFNQGRLGKAEELGTQVVESRKKVLGPEHQDTLQTMETLARIWANQQKFKEARKLATQVLDMQKRIIGPEHEDTLKSMRTLARISDLQGQLDEAGNMYSSVVEGRKRVMGPEHRSTLSAMNDLAWTWQRQGQLEKAEKLQRELWETTKRALGKEHPDTLHSMNSLAWTWQIQGQFNKAEELQREVWEASKRVLGKDHPDTLDFMSDLAFTWQQQGQFERAEELRRESWEAGKRNLGKEHQHTLDLMEHLACSWKHLGRNEEATQLLRESCRLREKVQGKDHPDTVRSAEDLKQWIEGQSPQQHVSSTS
ncbi:hypothetical protein FQN50_000999 [Emmonsiellopsis sp. PD_5]|nr:hypothetical protein FQN50_000999 [Emmonsiellopsis sp. PD_5]